MKRTAVLDRKSRFWSRLLGLLIVFAIISVLVFGGVKNLMGELSAVYEDLAASQSELAVTHHELAATQTELDSTQQELAKTANKLDRQTVDYVGNVRQLNYSRNLIVALANEKEQLKRSLSAVVSDLSKSHRQLHATDNALRAVEAELERQMSLPQVSVIVTTERLMQKSQRELFAASHVRMLAAGDDGMIRRPGVRSRIQRPLCRAHADDRDADRAGTRRTKARRCCTKSNPAPSMPNARRRS